MVRNTVVTLFKTLASYFLLELSTGIKFSFIVGSRRLFFSAINITGPLVGHYTGLGSFLFMVVRKKLTTFHSLVSLFEGGLFNPLVYYIPTLIASGYWFGTSRFIRVGLPLLCMILFIIHPIGHQAFFYSLFWLIPMAIHSLPRQNPFTEAVGTTFLAHGVGSVLMLYSAPLPVEYWLGLMPVVVVERLLFASGMTLVFYGAQGIARLWQNHKNHLMGIVGVTKNI